jgi:hypothetical protein
MKKRSCKEIRMKENMKHAKLFNAEHLGKIKDLSVTIPNLCTFNKDTFMEKCLCTKKNKGNEKKIILYSIPPVIKVPQT